MNNPEIPEGWRLVAEGEPIPTDTMWLDANERWCKLSGSHLIGEPYSDNYRKMITGQPANWRCACGTIQIGNDR